MMSDNPFSVDELLLSITKKALTHTQGNRTEASKLMGISVRTLRNWIAKYKITKEYPPAATRQK